MVRAVGIEPTLCYQNQILSLARLPVPPRPQTFPVRGMSQYKITATLASLIRRKRCLNSRRMCMGGLLTIIHVKDKYYYK
jgi:hypothetical protein